jgi:predicted transcriptional regulator of viral defense system
VLQQQRARPRVAPLRRRQKRLQDGSSKQRVKYIAEESDLKIIFKKKQVLFGVCFHEMIVTSFSCIRSKGEFVCACAHGFALNLP